MTDYEKFLGLYQEIDELIEKRVDSSSPEFKAWFSKSKTLLQGKFGKDSFQFEDFTERDFTCYAISLKRTGGIDWQIDHEPSIKKCREGLLKTKSVYESYLNDMKEDDSINTTSLDKSKIFIVHGHDGGLKSEVARLIEKQGISAIILSEKTNTGQTIIEKFEKHSNVGAAVLLFTADDVGKAKNGSKLAPRTRQNVVLETGYFMAKLGRKNIIIIYEEGVELPSDINGMGYTNKSNWEVDLLKELKGIGYNIDLNLLYSE